MFKVPQVKVHTFGISKCLQQRQNVGTKEGGITVIIITLKHIHVFLNPLKTMLNPICHLLALLGAHHILHVSRIRVKKNVI
jgi:transposase